MTGGTAFSVDGSSLDRDSLVLEAGLDVGVSARHTLGLGYSGEIRQQQSQSRFDRAVADEFLIFDSRRRPV